MGETCTALDITALFGDHAVGSTIPSFFGVKPCQDEDILGEGEIAKCTVECKNGWSTHVTLSQIPIEVSCRRVADAQPAVHMTFFGSIELIKAAPLGCKANECISTSDEEEAKKDTHILCTDSLIASGTTGNCKCTAEDPTTTTTQATTVTTSSALNLRVEIQAKMLLVALSTLSTLSFLV
jgi:hypothetical protein